MTRKKAGVKIMSIGSKDYKGLHKTYDYDKERATLLAEAMTELVEIEKRRKYLETLLADNANLKPFLWGTQDGEVIALHDLDDDHLKNILEFLPRNGRTIKPEIKAEARARGFEVPDDTDLKAYSMRIESGDYDEKFNDEW